MSHDHQNQRDHRQKGVIEAIDEACFGRHVGERGKPAKIDGDIFDEEIGKEILRHRDCHQGEDVDQPVEDAALADRRQEPEADRERHRDNCSIGGEKHRIGEARRDLRQHVAAIGERMAEIAMQHSEQPVEKSQNRWPIQTQVKAQLGQALRGGGILQDRRGEITWQNLRADEDEDRRGEQGQDAKAEPLEHEIQHNALSPYLT